MKLLVTEFNLNLDCSGLFKIKMSQEFALPNTGKKCKNISKALVSKMQFRKVDYFCPTTKLAINGV